jgi:hypothetical protein
MGSRQEASVAICHIYIRYIFIFSFFQKKYWCLDFWTFFYPSFSVVTSDIEVGG